MKKLFFALAVVLCACGQQEATVAPGDDGVATSEGSALSANPTLTFTGDWHVTQSGPLTKGAVVKVSYDDSRLPSCRGTQYGNQAWGITLWTSTNGGPAVAHQTTDALTLTDAGDLAVWFQITNVWGCTAWDSNYGANYHFAVRDVAELNFKADWTLEASGVKGAGILRVDYDVARLPQCRQDYNGMATWDVIVWYAFDGGWAQNQPVTAVNGYLRENAPAFITVPAGARNVALWFENSDRAGCVRWDSVYGQNYNFALR